MENIVQIDNLEIEITKELTSQKFGKIKFGKELQSNCEVIIKEITHPAQISFLLNGGKDALLSLNHQNLPKTLKIKWLSNQKAILIRELVKGLDLKSILTQPHLRKQLSTKELIPIFCKLLDALEYIHTQNIIHQDIKPSNIIINLQRRNNEVHKVTLIDLEQCKFSQSTPNDNISPFALIYSPPEQILKFNHLTDCRADIYALGITLYEAITHKRPFEHYDPEFGLNLQLTYPLKNEHNIDKNLFEIIKKATQKSPFPKPPHMLSAEQIEQILKEGIENRYASALQMRDALLAWTPAEKQKKWWNLF